MWLDLEWDCSGEVVAPACVRLVVRNTFQEFESGSIQQLIYQIGSKLLDDFRSISEVRLEANNRTWDTIAEEGGMFGTYTDSRPPFGCLGLTLRR